MNAALISWADFNALPWSVYGTELGQLPYSMNSAEAHTLIGAICMQETKFQSRRQIIRYERGPVGERVPVYGPAVGFEQFEEGGGIMGVLTHAASWRASLAICRRRVPGADLGTKTLAHDVWKAMQTDDVLGYAFARLLLFTDPKPLPRVGDVGAAYEYYEHIWRPGSKRPQDWADSYGAALTGAK